MQGLEIKKNGKYLCRAGLDEENGVLTCIVDIVKRIGESKEELNLNIGGLNSRTRQQVRWLAEPLKQGDTISVEVIDENYDPPTQITGPDSDQFLSEEEILKKKIEYFYQLKQELKDYL